MYFVQFSSAQNVYIIRHENQTSNGSR